MTRKQIIDAVRACAGKLKRIPTVRDLKRVGISRPLCRRQFGSIREALRAAGLEPRGVGYKPDLVAIMLDWAMVARKLGRAPTKMEYVREGKYSCKPFVSRFGRWSLVAENFLRLVRQWNIQQDWTDVIEAMKGALSNQQSAMKEALSNQQSAISKGNTKTNSKGKGNSKRKRQDFTADERGWSRIANGGRWKNKEPESSGRSLESELNTVRLEWSAHRGTSRVRLRARPGRAVCGAPMVAPGMIHEPVNEDGVICLFGMLAERLGLIVRRIQGAFPDCEVLYETEPGRWINLFVEFEFESCNYREHKHPSKGCDLLVCWVHNWRGCPADMEVLELKRIVREISG